MVPYEYTLALCQPEPIESHQWLVQPAYTDVTVCTVSGTLFMHKHIHWTCHTVLWCTVCRVIQQQNTSTIMLMMFYADDSAETLVDMSKGCVCAWMAECRKLCTLLHLPPNRCFEHRDPISAPKNMIFAVVCQISLCLSYLLPVYAVICFDLLQNGVIPSNTDKTIIKDRKHMEAS